MRRKGRDISPRPRKSKDTDVLHRQEVVHAHQALALPTILYGSPLASGGSSSGEGMMTVI